MFFFMIIIIRLNALSVSMSAFIFFSQFVSSPAVMNIISTYAYISDENPIDWDVKIVSVANVVTTVFGIWNLDFFRMIYKPFYLHPNLPITCLNYAIAVYPSLLISLTYNGI